MFRVLVKPTFVFFLTGLFPERLLRYRLPSQSPAKENYVGMFVQAEAGFLSCRAANNVNALALKCKLN